MEILRGLEGNVENEEAQRLPPAATKNTKKMADVIFLMTDLSHT
jgi:hypothetical protein